jgi:hypothetical protein
MRRTNTIDDKLIKECQKMYKKGLIDKRVTCTKKVYDPWLSVMRSLSRRTPIKLKKESEVSQIKNDN